MCAFTIIQSLKTTQKYIFQFLILFTNYIFELRETHGTVIKPVL